LSIEIEKPVLEKACREIIDTIVFCLPNALKGTIYRIGKTPDLIVERITSGIIGEQRKEISWGLPAESEYNPPGKPWVAYRDEPDRPLEAMSWCVQKQKSWTAEDPRNDTRSVRLQVEGVLEDFHHMEPVLVRKSDLNLDMYSSLEYPRDYEGNIVWKDSEYVVVAVIKIHFRPFTIKIGSHETRVIKKLSRSLGTELLSYQLRQDSMKTIQQVAKDRLSACNILADSLRNAITKTGLIFTLVKTEVGHLRDQWEEVLLQDRKEKNLKKEAIEGLNEILMAMDKRCEDLRKDLMDVQNRFLDLSLPPEKGENWVTMQIEERWKNLVDEYPLDEEKRKIIWETIDKLKKSLYFGRDPDIIKRYNKIPETVKQEWTHLVYGNSERFNASVLERLITVLGNPSLNIPSRERSRKILTQLKALAETMNQLEQINGGDERLVSEILDTLPQGSKPEK
jgi:hypothetical protein